MLQAWRRVTSFVSCSSVFDDVSASALINGNDAERRERTMRGAMESGRALGGLVDETESYISTVAYREDVKVPH